MDQLELQTLADELRADCAVVVAALDLAVRRFDAGSPAAVDSAAFHLTRCYNVIEQMALRVAKAFENTIDDEKGWHTELMRRVSIAIAGVRPAFLPEDLRPSLQELKAFRHLFVHAYDLQVDQDRLALVLKHGRRVVDALPGRIAAFLAAVALGQGLDLPRS